LGDTLPDVAIKRVDGSSVSLHAYVGARPALIYIFGVAECASCSNLPLEFQIVHRQAPGVVPLLIASGAPMDTLLPRVRAVGLETSTLIDERSSLLHALGVAREPLVIMSDSTGRIIFVDTRNAARAAQYPVGHILRDIGALVPATEARTR
jgi:peroxiredoxin